MSVKRNFENGFSMIVAYFPAFISCMIGFAQLYMIVSHLEVSIPDAECSLNKNIKKCIRFENTPRRINQLLPWQQHQCIFSACYWNDHKTRFLILWPWPLVWPMALIIKLDLDIVPLNPHAKIQVCMLINSAVSMRRTHRHTHNVKTITPDGLLCIPQLSRKWHTNTSARPTMWDVYSKHMVCSFIGCNTVHCESHQVLQKSMFFGILLYFDIKVLQGLYQPERKN